MNRLLAVAGTVLAAVWCCAGADAAPPAPGSPVGQSFWANPDSRAALQARFWEAHGRTEDAALLRRIAEQPMATWIHDTGPAAEDQVRDITSAAAYQDRVPVLVAYDIPHRDCGLYSEGGAEGSDAYRAWIARVAAGIEDRKAVVVLEPDAVPQLVAGCRGAERNDERLALLADAIRTLKARPGVKVYLDAGNAGWIADQKVLVEALQQAGVREADGFALNVSNFQTTRVSEAYGEKLSAALGGTHFVIDTSRNGNGPYEGGDAYEDAETWCNPPGRALGQPPTTATGNPLVDAYLWVKRPGESDGSCRGAPPAGQWWSDYALRLARAAQARVPVPSG